MLDKELDLPMELRLNNQRIKIQQQTVSAFNLEEN